MMNGDGKSDSAIVAVKPANEAQRCAKELVEPRAGAKGNAGEHSTRRTQSRESVTHGLERIRQIAKGHSWPDRRFAVKHPRQEPYALIGHVRICAGGAQ